VGVGHPLHAGNLGYALGVLLGVELSGCLFVEQVN
jgi:hypothetical protein